MIDDVIHQIGYLAKAADFKVSKVDIDLRLPRATYAEWISVFQNVFYNAINAMADSRKRAVEVSAHRSGARVTVLVQDTGVGINLAKAERFFEPFEREVNISPERRELGFGGTGLGLTIVRMICDRRGCVVRFVAPAKGFATAFALEWTEEE